MKRFLAAVLAVFFIFSAAGCGAQDETLHENGTALDYLVQVAGDFKYGKLRCYKYSTRDLWSLVSASREDVTFGKNSYGNNSVLYRMTNPVVFMYYPACDYYDGDYYYYKHDGEWFIDAYNRFEERLKPTYYGLDSALFKSLKLSENEVYRSSGGYRLHLLGLDTKNSVVRVDMDVSVSLEPHYLVIRTYPEKGGYVDYVECYFDDYNNDKLAADVPSGLNLSEINYLRKDYENK